MPNDQLTPISGEECVRLLAGQRVGRLAFVDGDLPLILPVNYVLDGGDVIVRTDPGSKLDAAVHGVAVAFEIDQVDEASQSGWSVLVRGYLDQVDSAEIERLRDGAPTPFAPGAKTHYVRVRAVDTTGRRIPQKSHPSDFWG